MVIRLHCLPPLSCLWVEYQPSKLGIAGSSRLSFCFESFCLDSPFSQLNNGSILSTSSSVPHIITSSPPHTLPSSSSSSSTPHSPTATQSSQKSPFPTVTLTLPSFTFALHMVPSDINGGSFVPVLQVRTCILYMYKCPGAYNQGCLQHIRDRLREKGPFRASNNIAS